GVCNIASSFRESTEETTIRLRAEGQWSPRKCRGWFRDPRPGGRGGTPLRSRKRAERKGAPIFAGTTPRMRKPLAADRHAGARLFHVSTRGSVLGQFPPPRGLAAKADGAKGHQRQTGRLGRDRGKSFRDDRAAPAHRDVLDVGSREKAVGVAVHKVDGMDGARAGVCDVIDLNVARIEPLALARTPIETNVEAFAGEDL